MRRSKWIIIIIGLGVLIGSGWWLLGHATTQKAQQVKQTENEQPTFICMVMAVRLVRLIA
ncbi:hypothetical protein LCW_07740 [Latilactobacillus curvatus]|uniref:Uncharacterized protein n=1 Tax=Latilactobacillus curvatus TaxID=28038 RepID=A0ABM7QT40_LATCU|nr:hypothetical protein [Latilactobacillus curvatus]AOO75949.1 hypothetical protein LCW_07740 [Latilactobacillus curvatus]BCX30258.1 hypothetical protein LTWDN19_08250 [Latilactobacillus curvatus]